MTSIIPIPAFFHQDGVPVTGLTPVIYIYNITKGTEDVDGENMTELGNGHYYYHLTAGDHDDAYVWTIDGGETLTPGARYKSGDRQTVPTRKT